VWEAIKQLFTLNKTILFTKLFTVTFEVQLKNTYERELTTNCLLPRELRRNCRRRREKLAKNSEFETG
jgi:hypothetical protein